MGPNGSKDIEVELDQMKKKIALYHSNETWLDESIDLMQTSLRALAEDSANQVHAYVTHDDIRAIGSFNNDTVIAIKAPSGTTLEVPDPDEGMDQGQRRYQIYLKSQTGPVEVFLVSPLPGEGDGEGAGEEAGTSAEGGGVRAMDAESTSSGVPSASGTAGGSSDAAAADPARGSKRARDEGETSSISSGAAPGGSKRGDPLLKLSPVGPAGDYWPEQSDAVGVSDLFAGAAE